MQTSSTVECSSFCYDNNSDDLKSKDEIMQWRETGGKNFLPMREDYLKIGIPLTFTNDD